jgi:hypothetical protein
MSVSMWMCQQSDYGFKYFKGKHIVVPELTDFDGCRSAKYINILFLWNVIHQISIDTNCKYIPEY